MSETEPKPDQTDAPPAAAPTISAADVRKHELFQKLTDDLQAQKQAIADMKAAQAKAEEDAKLKKLEEEQNWDALKAELQSKHEKELAAREAELVSERLTNKLVIAGVTHPFAILAAQQQYQPGDKSLDDFVAEFVASEQVQQLVKPAEPPTGLPGGDAAGGSPRSTDNNWAQLKADKASGDPKKMMAAAQAVKQYMIENKGKRPPGWD